MGNEISRINDYRGIAAYPNCALSTAYIGGMARLFYVVTVDIPAGSELLTDYGDVEFFSLQLPLSLYFCTVSLFAVHLGLYSIPTFTSPVPPSHFSIDIVALYCVGSSSISHVYPFFFLTRCGSQ